MDLRGGVKLPKYGEKGRHVMLRSWLSPLLAIFFLSLFGTDIQIDWFQAMSCGDGSYACIALIYLA
jgi:hypothetical protein